MSTAAERVWKFVNTYEQAVEAVVAWSSEHGGKPVPLMLADLRDLLYEVPLPPETVTVSNADGEPIATFTVEIDPGESW